MDLRSWGSHLRHNGQYKKLKVPVLNMFLIPFLPHSLITI